MKRMALWCHMLTPRSHCPPPRYKFSIQWTSDIRGISADVSLVSNSSGFLEEYLTGERGGAPWQDFCSICGRMNEDRM